MRNRKQKEELFSLNQENFRRDSGLSTIKSKLKIVKEVADFDLFNTENQDVTYDHVLQTEITNKADYKGGKNEENDFNSDPINHINELIDKRDIGLFDFNSEKKDGIVRNTDGDDVIENDEEIMEMGDNDETQSFNKRSKSNYKSNKNNKLDIIFDIDIPMNDTKWTYSSCITSVRVVLIS